MMITKIERSDSTSTLLVSDTIYGATVFYPESTDEESVANILARELCLGFCSHLHPYATYKAYANDWITIYDEDAL